MASSVRTLVIFDSDAFNLTEPKDYFINPSCFGDDLARWLIARLGERGCPTDDEPGQEDFGWYFLYEAGGELCCVVIGNFEETRWFIEIERHTGFLASLTGARRRKIPVAAVKVIHDILNDALEISSIGWHEHREFEKGIFDNGTPTPGG